MGKAKRNWETLLGIGSDPKKFFSLGGIHRAIPNHMEQGTRSVGTHVTRVRAQTGPFHTIVGIGGTNAPQKI